MKTSTICVSDGDDLTELLRADGHYVAACALRLEIVDFDDAVRYVTFYRDVKNGAPLIYGHGHCNARLFDGDPKSGDTACPHKHALP